MNLSELATEIRVSTSLALKRLVSLPTVVQWLQQTQPKTPYQMEIVG
jgi:hypothetical protein